MRAGVASGSYRGLPHQLPDPLTGQAARARAQEQEWRASTFSEYFPAVLQVALNRLLRGNTDWHHALLVSFATHQDVSHLKLQVFQASVRNFGDAHASRVKQLQHGAIANRQSLGARGLIAGLGCAQRGLNFIAAERFGQHLPLLRRVNIESWIFLDFAVEQQIAVKMTNRGK